MHSWTTSIEIQKYKKKLCGKKYFDKVSVIYISVPMIHTIFIIESILIILFCLIQDWNVWRQAVEKMSIWISVKLKKIWRKWFNSLLKACPYIFNVKLKLLPCLQFMILPLKYIVRQYLTYSIFTHSLKYRYLYWFFKRFCYCNNFTSWLTRT